MKDSVKKIFSFEFWQKFGKCLMVVIAVMPAAGLMISIGKTIPMIDPNAAILVTVGGVIEQIGWGVINNLHLLFALAIGGSWAKDRAGGAFAAGLSARSRVSRDRERGQSDTGENVRIVRLRKDVAFSRIVERFERAACTDDGPTVGPFHHRRRQRLRPPRMPRLQSGRMVRPRPIPRLQHRPA